MLTVSDMRRRPVAIGLLALAALLVALVGGPLGTQALGETATLVGGNQDGPVGTTVTINLGGFTNATAPVAFWNNKSLKRISYTQNTGIPQSITVQFQPWNLPPGTFPIVVKVGTEEATTAATFELELPQIVNVTPTAGPWLSNVDIEINGFPIGALNTYNPTLGGRPLTRVALLPGAPTPPGDGPDNVIIRAQIPNHAVDGTIGMRVGSLSATGPAFDVQTPNPQAGDIYPDTGAGGTPVEIEVTGYPPGTYYATFGGRPAPGNLGPAVPCSPTAVTNGLSGTCVTATVPVTASGTYAFQVRVGGYSNASDMTFTVPPPEVIGYSPTSSGAQAAGAGPIEIAIANFPLSGAISARIGSSPVTVTSPVPTGCVGVYPGADSCITVELRTYNPTGPNQAFSVTRSSRTDTGPATFTVFPSSDLEVTVTKTPNGNGTTGTLYVWAINVKNKGFTTLNASNTTVLNFPVGSWSAFTLGTTTTHGIGNTVTGTVDQPNNRLICSHTVGTIAPGQQFTCRALVQFNAGTWTPTVSPLTMANFDYNPTNNAPVVPAVVIV